MQWEIRKHRKRNKIKGIKVMFGWYLYNKDRKTAIRLTGFVIIILIIGVLLGLLLPKRGAIPTIQNPKTESVK